MAEARKRLRDEFHVEKKSFDERGDGFNISNLPGLLSHDPAANALNRVSQGFGDNQRKGDVIHIESCIVRGVIHIRPAVTAGVPPAQVHPIWDGELIFIALVLDTQDNGRTAPGAVAVFQDRNVWAPAPNVFAWDPLRNLDFVSRYKVLDKVTLDVNQFDYVSDTGTEPPPFQDEIVTDIHRSGKRIGFSLNWDGSIFTNFGGGILNPILDNSLHVVMYKDDPASIDTLHWVYNSRIRFHDEIL
nr:capsid protein [Cressdnaviricota sp.]UOF82984.1 capsid protein [Cressdnaviricota sp.]UOF83107.1 capsid protein [Cressdnaviricota sp.]